MAFFFAILCSVFCSLHMGPAAAFLLRQPIQNATSRGARCLDGSAAVYYMYRNTNSTRWVIHLETGTASCIGPGAPFCGLLRNPSRGGGTSQSAPCVLPEASSDRLQDVGAPVSSDSARNPEFYLDNRVFIPHCSADNFIGRNIAGTAYGGGVYFGGFHVVRAVVEDLLSNEGLATATELLFGGVSMGVLAHADWVHDFLPDTIALAVYTDGLGLPAVPTFADLQPMISDSISRGEQADFVLNYVLPDLSTSAGIASIYGTLNIMDPFPICENSGMTFGGLECYATATGVRLAITSGVPVFVFASVWDTSVLAIYLGLERYTCAAETGQLSEEERVYLAILGRRNYGGLLQTFNQRGNQVISVFAANCFTSALLEDDLLCVQVGGRAPYGALQFFLAQGQGVMEADATERAALVCSPTCGAAQCAWGSAASRTTPPGSNGCGSRMDGFTRFRTGSACIGQVYPTFAQSSIAAQGSLCPAIFPSQPNVFTNAPVTDDTGAVVTASTASPVTDDTGAVVTGTRDAAATNGQNVMTTSSKGTATTCSTPWLLMASLTFLLALA
eukprot:scpid58717/ scgid18940/ 